MVVVIMFGDFKRYFPIACNSDTDTNFMQNTDCVM